MPNLNTKYLGLDLQNPIIVSSSGITGKIETIEQCVQAGAGAIVLKSIFEEDVKQKSNSEENQYNSNYHPEAAAYIHEVSFEHSVHEYLELLEKTKKNIDIPVIASLNCVSPDGWGDFTHWIEEKGADALELNIFILPKDFSESANSIEDRYVKIIKEIKKRTKLAVAVKIAALFTNIGNFANKLVKAGADSLVLFNRFASIKPLDFTHSDSLKEGQWLSHPGEKSLVQYWMSALHKNISCDLSASSGIRNAKDIYNMILAGATTVQLASVLYLQGIPTIKSLINDLNRILTEKSVASLDDIRGKNSSKNNSGKSTHDRLFYYRAISELNKMH